MAHVGKQYPYLFERDFSTWESAPMLKLGRFYRTTTGPGLGTKMIGWRGVTIDTTEGVASYATSTVTFEFIRPAAANPITFFRLVYFLTYTRLLWNARVEIGDENGLTHQADVARNFSNPRTILGNSLNWIFPPFGAAQVFVPGTMTAKTWAQI